jgi:phosphoribosylformimino-5-aminoimidazole carboxamide ribotide isomerase
MIIIPSIDILDGECVRLVRGDYQAVTVYENDPVAMARRFEEAGARRIHIVDLDAARGDPRTNRKKVRKIRRAVDCTIQMGGGIRRDEDIEELLDLGIDRLVIGTAFAKRPENVEGWVAHYGDVFLVGIDALEGQVRISGWERETRLQDTELAARAREAKVAGIVYTSIGRDGTLEGPDVERTNSVADAAGLPVILSGGIGSIEHIRAAEAEVRSNVVGVIVGRAIYDEQISLDELFREPAATGGEEVTW